MDTATAGLEGVTGRLAGAVMARLNRDMEVAAVDELAPAAGASATMVSAARQRNRAAFDTGRVRLVQAGVASIPWPDAAFCGVVTVNSMQLWEPMEVALRGCPSTATR